MSTFNSATTTTPNFDNLLLQSLMGRLNLGPSRPNPNPLSSQSSFEDFLSLSLSSTSDNEDGYESGGGPVPTKTQQLAKEESRLEKEIIKVILSGKAGSLKPNSGQAVSIGEHQHHVCVGYHEESGGSDYRVWEWHGHIMLFDEDDGGYTPEYIYGNYFERLIGVVGTSGKKKEEVEVKKKEEVSKEENLGGLRELIDVESEVNENGGLLGKSRILHRSLHAGSPSRALEGSVEK